MNPYVHGENIKQKIQTEKNAKNLEMLKEIEDKYNEWKNATEGIVGTSRDEINKKVALLNEYKDFIDQPKFRKVGGNPYGFTPQSKLHPSVIEEFCYYLFKDLSCLQDGIILLGPTMLYLDMSFAPRNLRTLKVTPEVDLKKKHQDFAFSKEVYCKFSADNKVFKNENICVPAVAIECKTYLPITMLDQATYEAERLKRGNPYSLYIILTETTALRREVNLKHTKIDEVFILRKQRRDAKPRKPIDAEVVYEFFKLVENYLTEDWRQPDIAIKRGRLIG